MQKKEQSKALVRVFAKGGIISLGDFSRIIHIAKALGTDYIHLGARQDILFPVFEEDHDKADELLLSLPLPYEYKGKQYQNIVSSYVTLDVMPSASWLAPHIYHYVLDSFQYLPRHKINIIDPIQGMIPLFTGNINFVASETDNYWYLYIRYSAIDDKPWCCPELIYGFDLATVARAIEEADPAVNKIPFAELYRQIREQVKFNTRPIEKPLEYPDTTFPYYEGMNRIESDKYWLGLYWRNNQFTIKFLMAFCQQCLETDIGKISFTPWKSFIIKGISEKDRLDWEKLLGKYGINMRHSSLELNWHLPVLDQDALTLKNYLVRILDQHDISTYGLTFTVKTSKHRILFTSVVIEKADNEQDTDSYNILYARNFNPNLFEYYYYARGVTKNIIPPLLIEISKKYYEQLDTDKPYVVKTKLAYPKKENKKVWQCGQCLNVYDAALGDILSGVSSGVNFDDLPPDYCCPVCGSRKTEFREVRL